jgi:hypothetical protein
MVICKTPYHVVESYGNSLPVMVTETIAYADSKCNATFVKIDYFLKNKLQLNFQ